MTHLVTRDFLQALIDQGGDIQMHTVGRALVVLFKRQTAAEKDANTTNVDNGVGFTGADGFGGCLGAKKYLKDGCLPDWVVQKWVKRSERTGYSRIVKYWKQLDEAAKAKKANKEQREAA
jgi:hypothetical protein